jgi:CHAT domain-containing protein
VTQNTQEGRYLIEDVPIAYISSASLLKTLRGAVEQSQAAAPYPLLAFAHPIYDAALPRAQATESLSELRSLAYGSFKELPETEEEARAVAALLAAPTESDPLQLRDRASRDTVFRFNTSQRLKDYRYLLFATHGVLPEDTNQVTQPALVLSYPQNNGYLTMADVFGLRLNARLVTLSACNTGGGERVRGEGVMGLTRAFMYAGTPAVAVTLWSVESSSAKTLSVGLFRALKDMENPAYALRASKLCMLRGDKGEQYRHPYYWAPFVIFGDAGPSYASGTTGDKIECNFDRKITHVR